MFQMLITLLCPEIFNSFLYINQILVLAFCMPIFRTSHPELFLVKGVLKTCRKFTGEHACRRVTSKMLHSNFIEIALRHGCSPVNLLHIFRAPFPNLWTAASEFWLSSLMWFGCNWPSKFDFSYVLYRNILTLNNIKQN